jgi:hypothetical protein
MAALALILLHLPSEDWTPAEAAAPPNTAA